MTMEYQPPRTDTLVAEAEIDPTEFDATQLINEIEHFLELVTTPEGREFLLSLGIPAELIEINQPQELDITSVETAIGRIALSSA